MAAGLLGATVLGLAVRRVALLLFLLLVALLLHCILGKTSDDSTTYCTKESVVDLVTTPGTCCTTGKGTGETALTLLGTAGSFLAILRLAVLLLLTILVLAVLLLVVVATVLVVTTTVVVTGRRAALAVILGVVRSLVVLGLAVALLGVAALLRRITALLRRVATLAVVTLVLIVGARHCVVCGVGRGWKGLKE